MVFTLITMVFNFSTLIILCAVIIRLRRTTRASAELHAARMELYAQREQEIVQAHFRLLDEVARNS
jgi:hypothetical protein